MVEVRFTAASLRIIGEDLNVEEITSLLEVAPHRAMNKGDVEERPNGQKVVSRTGIWSRKVDRSSPANLDAQIAELLEPLPQNLSVWQLLTKRFRTEVFCGAFMLEGNEGLGLNPETLLALGSRGIALELDIYGPERTDHIAPLPHEFN
ncbi:DUF4279 domain-containing protein [Phyllobacterium sp. YR531]|uniref:DUF4279 domain-containing protein n=1 Tax=Phyllobacterium sp. YR531 TaxID=1144343 RepID=UPI00026F8755|nr:DUF4279 domain-containing protein [Phyllobacterium sp. YR531]EJN01709.1 hypothetical protein PMI41_03425 [Phyllobacterium sp. YR531]